MLAAPDRPRVAALSEEDVYRGVENAAPTKPGGPVDAGRLLAAIEHHRSESRRLAQAAQQHRTQLRDLLRQRDRHITQLRAAGWPLSRIGTLYKVTKERVGQITTPRSATRVVAR